jgi:hypothetical protein
MVEKQVQITYKKSRNPRAAKLWETSYYFTAMQYAMQVKHDIEKVAVAEQKQLKELGNTAVSTDMLWYLADTYLDAYKLLMKESLIKSGNIHKIQPTIH